MGRSFRMIGFPHVSAFRDRHGKVRFRFRRKGSRVVCLPGAPGSPEFLAAIYAAHADRKKPTDENLRTLVGLYRASPEFTGLADATRKVWLRWLDLVSETEGELAIGGLPWAALDVSCKSMGFARR